MKTGEPPSSVEGTTANSRTLDSGKRPLSGARVRGCLPRGFWYDSDVGAGASVSTGSSHTFKRSGIADEPDLTRLTFRELDVTPSFGLHPNDAYDLALFAEQGSTSRGVLVVTMVKASTLVTVGSQ